MPLVCTASSGEEDTSFHLLPPEIQEYIRVIWGDKNSVICICFVMMVVVFCIC